MAMTVLATRVPEADGAVLDTLARLRGVTISGLLRDLVVPAARRELAQWARGMDGTAGPPMLDPRS